MIRDEKSVSEFRSHSSNVRRVHIFPASEKMIEIFFQKPLNFGFLLQKFAIACISSCLQLPARFSKLHARFPKLPTCMNVDSCICCGINAELIYFPVLDERKKGSLKRVAISRTLERRRAIHNQRVCRELSIADTLSLARMLSLVFPGCSGKILGAHLSRLRSLTSIDLD